MSKPLILFQMVALCCLQPSQASGSGFASSEFSPSEIAYVRTGQLIPILTPGQLIYIANPAVMKARMIGGKDFLQAKKTGDTLVQVGKKSALYRVLTQRQHDEYLRLQPLLAGRRGLYLNFQKGQFEVRGELLRLTDLIHLCENTDDGLKLNLHVFHGIRGKVQKHLKTVLRERGIQRVDVQFPRLALKSLEKTDYCGLPHIEVEGVSALPEQHTIELLFLLATERELEQVGLRGITQLPVTSMPLEKMDVFLDQVASNGTSRSHYKTQLRAPHNETVTFNSGGEFAVRTNGFGAARVEWKQHGLQIEITTKRARPPHLEVDMNLELSAIDASQTIDGIPGLVRRSLKQKMFLRKDHYSVITQFTQMTRGQGQERFWLFKNVPIINQLLGHTQNAEDKQEIVLSLRLGRDHDVL